MSKSEVKVSDLVPFYGKFVPTQEYLDNMPDMQNSEFEGRYIDMVGISNFRVPLTISQRDGGAQTVLASIHGFCDVQSYKLGLNMSRIIRTFYKSKDEVFDINRLETILKQYQKDQESFNTNLKLEFDYYVTQNSLVSVDDAGNPNVGYYIVHCVLDASLDRAGQFTKKLTVYWQYSSACKCSTALSRYVGEVRGVGANPHSQRSTAAVTIEFEDMVWIEDIIDHCRNSLVTECQAIVKREDEAEFAVLNYTYQKFIEDATRVLAKELDTDARILDYKVLMCHAESLHQSSVIGLITKGIENSKFTSEVTSAEIRELEQLT
jgi:GTP cyclohydrolase I